MSNLLYPFQDRPETQLTVGGVAIDLSGVGGPVRMALEAMQERVTTLEQALQQASQVEASWHDLIPRRFAADSTVAAKSASFTPEAEIQWFRVDATSGAITVTVPLSASNPYRTIGVIKTDSSANAVTLTRSGSDTINGATTLALSSQYAFAIIKANGITAWDIAGHTASASGSSDIVFAAAPNADTAVNDTNLVTIISKSVTGIAAGDQIQLDVWFTLLNNSGANRQYLSSTALGSFAMSSSASGTNVSANATNRKTFHIIVQFSVSATNLAYAQSSAICGTNGTAADTPSDIEVASSDQNWDTSTSDLTGTQTLTFSVAASNATATQTLTLHSYTIRKISTV